MALALIRAGLADTDRRVAEGRAVTPMFLFGGVFFPFTDLPGWAQAVGWCLPLSHLVAASRDLTLGGADLWTLVHVGALVAILVVVLPFPAARLRRTLLR